MVMTCFKSQLNVVGVLRMDGLMWIKILKKERLMMLNSKRMRQMKATTAYNVKPVAVKLEAVSSLVISFKTARCVLQTMDKHGETSFKLQQLQMMDYMAHWVMVKEVNTFKSTSPPFLVALVRLQDFVQYTLLIFKTKLAQS